MQAREREKDNRRDWIIVILIILIGLLCILLAGGWALRLTPSWKLNSNMGSNLDPNSDFLTARTNGLIEPIDASILTQPSWLGVYLTPGATFKTGTPFPTTVKNTLPPPATQTPVPTNIFPTLTTTSTPKIIIYPTNTRAGNPSTRTPAPTKTSTPSVAPASSADLSIVITDGTTIFNVGGTITYMIVVRNTSGPAAANGATVIDTFPAALSGITWTCTGNAGGTCPANGSGNINQIVNLPVGASVTYTVNANVSAAATGNLVNTVSVTPPATISDPAAANNTATDIDTPIFNADLQITKTDGVGTYLPGTSTTYTIVVSNTGPVNATGATITDTFPVQVINAAWSCVTAGGATCPASGTGSINHTVNLPVGSSITYTVNATISSAATGNLVNTASVTPPVSTADPIPANNTATDTDTPIFTVDLQITKTDGVATYTPGTSTTYTIVVTNPTGPSNVTGATVTDTFPAAQVSSAVWTCVATAGATCTANGTGNINNTVDIPFGGMLTYTVTVNIASSATGNLINTATITAPGGYNDTTPGNNSATDTDTPVLGTDLSITKTDNATYYAASTTKVYSIVVANAGPSDVIAATVTDAFPAQIASATWSCASTGGAVCTANGAGNINDSINVPMGSSVTYTVSATIDVAPAGDLVNTASVSLPVGYTDPTPGNNSATDTDTLIVVDPTPGGIGPTPDGIVYNLMSGSTLTQSINLVVNGHASWDLVYYERPAGSGVLLDWMVIEISDGQNWYTIFNWGDNVADTNTNVDFNILPLPTMPPIPPPEEPDQRDIPSANLYNLTGIAINLDGVVPPGTYSFIRFYAPPGDVDGHSEIDAIEVLP